MSLLDLYFLSNWLPTVLNDLGASVPMSAAIGSMLQVGGVVGTFAIGAIGQLGHPIVLVTVAIFAAGFCFVGGQIAANALAATFYPTSVRASAGRSGSGGWSRSSARWSAACC
jgi:AAHS family 4-hydroxybenzoate transporter-like MFS transporter